jgi:N-formylglutamate deformylase
MNPVEIHRGDGPLVLGLPHTGLYVPDDVLGALNETGRALADTDWNVHRLYDALLPGLTTIRATFHRYVIDANRDPSGVSLYPGQNTTGLCPLTDFEGRALYRENAAPDATEIERRRRLYHAPYHAALAAELARIRALHGAVVLYDCHSIRSRIPYLFEGTLPDFNIGTNSSTSCASEIEQAVRAACEAAPGYGSIVNGRFKGGWTTRHYGDPDQGVHAIQMELTQATYMDEAAPWTYRPERAQALRPHLVSILRSLDNLARGGALQPKKRAS